MLKTLRFEPIRAEHIPAILLIESMVHGAPWSEKSFQNEIDHPHGLFLVAIMDGNVVGYGGLWLVIDEAHVTTLAVSEHCRRQGIGARLMIQLLETAISMGMVCSTLEVRAGNVAAINLYRKLGYQETATRRGYYPDNNEDAIVMWLYDLETWTAPIS